MCISHDEVGVVLSTFRPHVETSVPQVLTHALDMFLYGTFPSNPMAAESAIGLEERCSSCKVREGDR